jgi:hypothetical protein
LKSQDTNLAILVDRKPEQLQVDADLFTWYPHGDAGYSTVPHVTTSDSVEGAAIVQAF